MPLDESLYQQHHRVLARIDQLGKGAASRLPPEAVAQIKALEAQLATAQGEADALRAQLAHELIGELSRDELMEALTSTMSDLEASQQALRASEAARDAAVAQAASAVAREQRVHRLVDALLRRHLERAAAAARPRVRVHLPLQQLLDERGSAAEVADGRRELRR